MGDVIRGRLALDREMMEDEMSVAPVSFPVLVPAREVLGCVLTKQDHAIATKVDICYFCWEEKKGEVSSTRSAKSLARRMCGMPLFFYPFLLLLHQKHSLQGSREPALLPSSIFKTMQVRLPCHIPSNLVLNVH